MARNMHHCLERGLFLGLFLTGFLSFYLPCFQRIVIEPCEMNLPERISQAELTLAFKIFIWLVDKADLNFSY
jgi:hypothetical protein